MYKDAYRYIYQYENLGLDSTLKFFLTLQGLFCRRGDKLFLNVIQILKIITVFIPLLRRISHYKIYLKKSSLSPINDQC